MSARVGLIVPSSNTVADGNAENLQIGVTSNSAALEAVLERIGSPSVP